MPALPAFPSLGPSRGPSRGLLLGLGCAAIPLRSLAGCEGASSSSHKTLAPLADGTGKVALERKVVQLSSVRFHIAGDHFELRGDEVGGVESCGGEVHGLLLRGALPAGATSAAELVGKRVNVDAGTGPTGAQLGFCALGATWSTTLGWVEIQAVEGPRVEAIFGGPFTLTKNGSTQTQAAPSIVAGQIAAVAD